MLKQSIQVKLGTQLKLTPQLKHSLRILQMSVLDLQTELQNQLESNVMLERDPVESSLEEGTNDSDTDTWQDENSEAAPAKEDQWDDVPTSELNTDYSVPNRNNQGSLPDNREYADTRVETLADHLKSQLDLDRMQDEERFLFEYLIDDLDTDGFLSEPLNEIRAHISYMVGDPGKKALEQALMIIQECDPAGVGAENLKDSLQIQLKRLQLDPDILKVCLELIQHLDLIAKNKLKVLRRICRTSEEKLVQGIEIVRKLSPRPAASFAQIETIHVIPDVVVKRHQGQWALEVNQASIPRLHVNKHYAKCIRGKGNDDLKQQLQEARWLIQGLVMRSETLIKVSQAIVSHQVGFLENGETAMQPMMMRELAEILSVHESTISRVVANKYMQTPRGTYPLRFFFSSQITNDAGESHSATAIKGFIAELIDAENPAKPLSDNKLALKLKEQGMPVARRTVAKYRESLGIESSSERKTQ